MDSHEPAEDEEPILGRAAGIDYDDVNISQPWIQYGSTDRKEQERLHRVNKLDDEIGYGSADNMKTETANNNKGYEKNQKSNVYFNANPTKRNKRLRRNTSDDELMRYRLRRNSRHTLRKRKKWECRATGHKYRLASYCVGENILLDAVDKAIKSRRLKTEKKWKVDFFIDMLHCYLEPNAVPSVTDSEPSEDQQHDLIGLNETVPLLQLQFRRDVFIFSYGCVVFWGFTKAEEQDFMALVDSGISEAVTGEELQESFDTMTFTHVEKEYDAEISGNNIPLTTETVMEKMSYSFSLAQSSKLFVYQSRVVECTESARQYPFTLMTTGRLTSSVTQVNKLIGKIFVLRNEVNLHSDILDTPDFFWDEDKWESAYDKLCNYLDIDERIDILNQRMAILKDLLEVLSTCVSDTHATKLEKIIIYLIILECCVEIVWGVFIQGILGLFNHCDCH